MGRAPADITLDLDPDARPTLGEGPMIRVLAPASAPSPDVNRCLLTGGEWSVTFCTADGRAAWASRPLRWQESDDAEALLARATLAGVEALAEGWEPMLQGAAPTPLPTSLLRGRWRAQETFLIWERPAPWIVARVRACAGPYGGARAQLGETHVWLMDATPDTTPVPPGTPPGTILSLGDGLVIATGRGAVRVRRLRPGWRPVRRAEEFAEETGLSPGYQFS